MQKIYYNNIIKKSFKLIFILNKNNFKKFLYQNITKKINLFWKLELNC